MLLLFEKKDSGVREEHDARERENVLIAVPCGDEKISIMMKIEWRYWQTQINEICRLRGDTYLFKASESGIFFSETTFWFELTCHLQKPKNKENWISHRLFHLWTSRFLHTQRTNPNYRRIILIPPFLFVQTYTVHFGDWQSQIERRGSNRKKMIWESRTRISQRERERERERE